MPTGISFCDEVWNVLAGCEKIGAGCANCWAEKMTIRQNAMAAARGDDGMWATYTNILKFDYGHCEEGKAIGWNGRVETLPQRLDIPLHWKKPSRIFVNSMSDTFHKDVPWDYIDRIHAVMALCPQHEFILFTKRWEPALKYYSDSEPGFNKQPVSTARGRVKKLALDRVRTWPGYRSKLLNMWDGRWPLRNAGLYFSVSTQAEVDKAIPTLLQISVATKGLSLEPLLGPIGFYGFESLSKIDSVIVGCESGPNRRPCKKEWVRDIVKQCREAGVLCYVKQLNINGKVSTNPEEWPEDVRVRGMP